ncbi:DNA gyrase subunit A, partial [Bacillus velezensis]|nr:DNA gyrase subunit A [Bacillus velezensis]
NEYSKTMAAIADYEDILAKPERIDKIIYEELLEIQEKFGDERRTELMVGEVLSIEDEDLIEEENVVVTLTHNGYIKRLPTSDFKAQNRGG